jgi:hypothetical protein
MYRYQPFPHYEQVSALMEIVRSQKKDDCFAGESHLGNTTPPIEGPSSATSQFASQIPGRSIGSWSGFTVPSTSSTSPSLLSSRDSYMPSPIFTYPAAQQAQISMAYGLQPEPPFPAHLSMDQSVHGLPEFLPHPTPSFMLSRPDDTTQQLAGNVQQEHQPGTPFSLVDRPLSSLSSGSQADCATPQSPQTDLCSDSQSVLSSRPSFKRRHSESVPPICDGLPQHLLLLSGPGGANISLVLVNMAGAMNNLTTAWHQSVMQTAEISVIIAAMDTVRDSDDLTEDEKIQLYLFLNNNPMLAATVPGMALGF